MRSVGPLDVRTFEEGIDLPQTEMESTRREKCQDRTIVQLLDFRPQVCRSMDIFLLRLAEALQERGWRSVHIFSGEPSESFRARLRDLESPYFLTELGERKAFRQSRSQGEGPCRHRQGGAGAKPRLHRRRHCVDGPLAADDPAHAAPISMGGRGAGSQSGRRRALDHRAPAASRSESRARGSRRRQPAGKNPAQTARGSPDDDGRGHRDGKS